MTDIRTVDIYGHLIVKDRRYHTQQFGTYFNNLQFKIFKT